MAPSVELPSDVEPIHGETVLSRRWANRTQHKLRAVGGRLYLTDRRVLFCPHVIDKNLAGQFWQARLSDITEVGRQKKDFRAMFSGGMRDRLKVTCADGSTNLFVINKLDQVIAEIQAAATG